MSVEDLYKQEDLDLKKEAEKAKKSNKLVTTQTSTKSASKTKNTIKK